MTFALSGQVQDVERWYVEEPGPAELARPGGGVEVAFVWRIRRPGDLARLVRVDVSGVRFDADLSQEARQALRTRGRSAVEAVLDEEEPPERLVVTPHGVQPGEPQPTPRRSESVSD